MSGVRKSCETAASNASYYPGDRVLQRVAHNTSNLRLIINDEDHLPGFCNRKYVFSHAPSPVMILIGKLRA